MKKIVMILLALIFSSCNDIFNSDDNVNESKNINYVGFYPIYCGSMEYKHSDEKFVVIRNETQLKEFTESLEPLIFDSDGNAIPLKLGYSDVNFEKNTLIAIMLGMRPTTAQTINVNSIIKEKDKLLVSVSEIVHSVGGTTITYPMQIIAIPKTNKEIVFEPIVKEQFKPYWGGLTNQSWTLIAYSNVLQKYTLFDYDFHFEGFSNNFWIEFDGDCNQGNGKSGCNSFSFSYGISGDKLSILRGGTTKALCPLSEEFQRALGKAISYRFKSGELVIETSDKLFTRMYFISNLE